MHRTLLSASDLHSVQVYRDGARENAQTCKLVLINNSLWKACLGWLIIYKGDAMKWAVKVEMWLYLKIILEFFSSNTCGCDTINK